jgi:hypothetical protein
MGGNGGPIRTYHWTIKPAPPGSQGTAQTRIPSVLVGPSAAPGPFPEPLPIGDYEVALEVQDAQEQRSQPHILPLRVVPPIESPGRPIAALQVMADGKVVESSTVRAEIVLNGRDSLTTGANRSLESYFWTWQLVNGEMAGGQPWMQNATAEPELALGRELPEGLYRFRLVVFENKELRSEPVDALLRLLPLI